MHYLFAEHESSHLWCKPQCWLLALEIKLSEATNIANMALYFRVLAETNIFQVYMWKFLFSFNKSLCVYFFRTFAWIKAEAADPIKAANVYKNIVEAIDRAAKAAKIALENAMHTAEMVHLHSYCIANICMLNSTKVCFILCNLT